METKSLARSKRAHSQHHSRKSNQTSKSKSSSPSVPSDQSEANAKNQTGKQVKERSRQFHGSSSSKLPSNWDRYEEAMEEPGSGDEAVESAKRASEVVVPKSKGADFRHLISEAESQLQSRSGDASESFGSFDDDMSGFDQGISSMLSVRGNGIMSWVGDDDFVVDDKSSMGYEATFFSLDLHTLAAQLEKIDVSKRLFIEADLLPPELYAEESREEGTCTSVEAERNMHGKSKIVPAQNASGYSPFPCEGTQVVDQGTSIAIKSKSIRISPSDEDKLTHLAKDESKHFDQTNLGDLVDFIAELDQTSVLESNEKKVSRFKAFDAESELDMLLNSFGQTNLDSSSTNKMPNESIPIAKWNDSGSVSNGALSLHGTQPLVNGVSSSRSVPATVNLEDKVDELLAELSNLNHQEGVPSLYANGKSLAQSSNSSKSVDMTLDLDSTVDDLLAEASDLQGKKGSVVPLQHDANLTDFTKPSPQSTTKLLDDFNSWLDTI